MSKFKVVNLIDKLFVSTCIFLIIFAWINFYIHSLWATFFLSLIFSFSCVYVLYFIIERKQTKNQSIKHNEENINEKFLLFKLSPKIKKLELLKKILSVDYQVSLKNTTLTYTKDNKTHLIIIATQFDRLSNNEFLNLLDENASTTNYDFIDIICNEYSIIRTDIFTDKKIVLINKEKLFNEYFVRYNTYPENNNINLSISKLKFKEILKGFFVPSKAKSYFFCGLILVFSSIILPYHAYYVVVGSMLLMFSIICKLMKKFTLN